MNEIGNPVRQKRRMAGIPPLASDLIGNAGETAMSTAVEVQPQPEPARILTPEDHVAGQQASAEASTATAASVNRRRMAGASNVPLLVSSAAPNGAAAAVSVNSPAGEFAQPPARTELEDAVPQDQLREVPSQALDSTLVRGRRRPGPSTVPVVVALQESRPANEPASTSSNQQIPATASNLAAGEASSVPERQRLRQASQPEAGKYDQPASAKIDDDKREAAPRSTKSLASENSAGSANASIGDAHLNSRTANKTRSKYAKRSLQVAGLLAIAVIAVLAAQWLRSTSTVQEFITTYSGHASQPISTPEGIPAWLGWQHFLNMFFMVLIVRSGLQVRLQNKPPGYWTAKQRSFFSPGNQPPKKISITQWLHQVLDVAWVVNGVLFVAALFITGFWMRIVPRLGCLP